ncbi:MAG: hypothetical protein M1831_000399 [Alyxoria varia]|nr:MAG: hypothetical protein M1831_000399 [Alyxoria varia]
MDANRCGNPHGVKRAAQDNVENTQRLAKRFHLLNINNDGKLWVGTNGERAPAAKTSTTTQDNPDLMQVEDTKDRIFIHNLDEELAEVADDGEQIVFLPEIEKRLSNLPKRLLTSDQTASSKGKEVVLYNVPASLSIPEDKDSVRKAMLEARARAQENQNRQITSPSHDAMLHNDSTEDISGGQTCDTTGINWDEDAMDIE